MNRRIATVALTVTLTSATLAGFAADAGAANESATWGQLKSRFSQSQTERPERGLMSAQSVTSAEDFTTSQMFELARHLEYRVPIIASDPNSPSERDALTIERWEAGFSSYLETVSLSDVVVAVTAVLDGTYTDEVLTVERLVELARHMGYRVPILASDFSNPSLGEAILLANWRDAFLRYLDEDVATGDLVNGVDAFFRGDLDTPEQEMSTEDAFELARHTGFRVPVIASDPGDPSLTDAVVITRWRASFLRHIDENVSLASLIRCMDEITRGLDHVTLA